MVRWVPVLNSVRLLAREWLCESPRLLYGFATRGDSEALLAGREEGCFLVRFSTTHLGLLAISFVAPRATGAAAAGGSEVSGRQAIQHCLVQVTPDSCDLFMGPSRRRYDSFQDLVRDCGVLESFYPGVPKHEALAQLRRASVG
jgi:hypothetical protein